MPLRSCSGRLVTVPPHGTCSSHFGTESRERRNRLLRISEMLPRKAGLVRFPPSLVRFSSRRAVRSGRLPGAAPARGPRASRPRPAFLPRGRRPLALPPAAGCWLHPPLLAWPGFAPLRLVCLERGPRPDGGWGAAWCMDVACGLSFQERRLRCAGRWGSSCHVRHPPGGRRSIRMWERPTRPPGASFKTRGLLMVSGVIRGHF